MGLIAASVMMAQSAPKSVTINESDIQFWTGTGSNSTVVAIGWDDDDANYTPTVVVWGIHWNGTISLQNALDTIMAYDSRFSYTISGGFVNSLNYNDQANGVSLTPSASWNCNNYGGTYGSTNLSSTWLRISESTCDNYNFTGVNNLIYASNPNGGTSLPDTVDASLPFSEILFWVGTGTDSAEFIVNFAQPDTAFAWGYLFNGSTTAQAMIDAIAAADPRFWIEGSPSVSGDIHFVTDNGDTLGLSPVDPNVGYNFWWTNLNGVSASSGSASTLQNGDVFKYGDLNSATGWDYMWGFYMEEAWNTIPTPVSVPSTTPETPVEATIDFADILYWVGTGSNEAVLAVNWADTALAWGYRWNGTKTVGDMLNEVSTADPRFIFVPGGYGVDDLLFVENGDTLHKAEYSWWGSTNNGVMDWGVSQTLVNGDLEKWADGTTGVLVDSNWVEDYGGYWDYIYVYPMTIHPVSVPEITPENATIAASDIHYWIGEGQNEAIFVVNWATKAYAWGYRFSTESVSLAAVMDDIAAADERFAYTMNGGYLSDITYNDGTENLTGTSWWSHLLNGEMSAGMASYLHDGDFSRWADPAAGVLVDSTWVEEWGGYWDYTYVYPMPITPVEAPITAGPFCGIVGSEGCNAIAADSNVFVAWATACTVELGPQNISVPGSPLVSYHTAQDAVGPCNMTDNLSVVSLGDGGSATLTFAQPIADGPGPDFAVFENSFGDYFLELAFVEVSSDGERFVRFPATSLTQTNTQVVSNVDPTYINNLAGKFRMGYGTPFDLNELRDSTGIDINNITHVRVVDVVGSIDPQYATYDAFGHIVNDPWPTDSYSGGFDLDGVGVINVSGNSIADVEDNSVSVYPNPTADLLQVKAVTASTAELYDFSGRLAKTFEVGTASTTVSLADLPAGVYMLRVAGTVQKIVKL